MDKILLVDVDSKIPNLALMKLSTYYKSKGYDVELRQLNYSYYPHKNTCVIYTDEYSKVMVSTIFKNNSGRVKLYGSAKTYFGGVGYNLSNELPECVESCEPDYSLYPDNDISYGFITRGCIRDCYFCVVPQKEGMIHQVAKTSEVVKHKKVKFLDNNILAFKGHKEILQELIDKKIRCQFNQGLDIRLLNDENAELLSKMNYMGEYIFAFDSMKDEQLINNKLALFKKYVSKDWKAKFFIYCHPDMDIQTDVKFRIEWCKENKVLPYFMRDQSCWDSKNSNLYIYLAAWCNQPSLFKKLSFDEFMLKRTKNVERQKSSINCYLPKTNNEKDVMK